MSVEGDFMQVDFEQALETVQSLSPQDYQKLRRWMDEHHHENGQTKDLNFVTTEHRDERMQLTKKWLAENRRKYLGEWIALDGDKLISHDKNGRKVIAEAKASGVKHLFLDRITDDELPFGGW